MNKKSLFMTFVLVAFATSAWAQCKTGDGTVVYCKWGECNSINLSYESAGTTCPGAAKNCIDNSDSKTLYSDASCNTTFSCDATCQAGLSQGVVDETCSGYCKWGGTCGPITTDKEGINGSVNATCQDAIENCAENSPDKTAWSNSTCTTPLLVGGSNLCKNGSGKQYYCQWDTGCYEIKKDGTETCDQLLAACDTDGDLYIDVNSSALNAGNEYGDNVICADNGGTKAPLPPPGSSSSGGGGGSSSSGGTPIIVSYNGAPVTGLNVVHFANSLRIASSKDATVSLFDMRGKQVFGQKVFSGTTTINLENQKQGVYYAVITSGSQKQTVKVVLK
jgi:hypothetical protein